MLEDEEQIQYCQGVIEEAKATLDGKVLPIGHTLPHPHTHTSIAPPTHPQSHPHISITVLHPSCQLVSLFHPPHILPTLTPSTFPPPAHTLPTSPSHLHTPLSHPPNSHTSHTHTSQPPHLISSSAEGEEETGKEGGQRYN